MSQDLMNMQMGFLLEHQGELVKCIYWDKGVRKEVEGRLVKVVPFDYLSIEGNKPLTFVGIDVAIEKVVSLEHKKSGENDIIYLCSAAEKYPGVGEHDHYALVNAQVSILGRSLRKESLDKAYDNAPEIAKPHIVEGGRGYHDVENTITDKNESITDDVGRAR